jgi:putative zinc finger/helix-turn-helix YgiT family protein
MRLKGGIEMIENIIFCEECRKDVAYIETEEIFQNELKGEAFEYKGKKAVCNECGSEVYVAEIEDYNLKELYDAYRTKNSIISLENILAIPEKYGIGKRPLSLLLGWGEMTFSRYCDGDMPSKQYSDILQQIYNEPAFYDSILETNKNKLKSLSAYEKSKRVTEKLLGANNIPLAKIDVVIEYLLCICEDITPLALQKVLYYIQGFYYAFMDEFIFEEDCEAWAHGPVFPNIYHRYSSYRFDPIDGSVTCDEPVLTIYEKTIIDSIIKNLCCYSGKILERFTHSEMPWLITRGDLPVSASSNRIIHKKELGKYFKVVKERFNMINPTDIENYSTKMFEQIN